VRATPSCGLFDRRTDGRSSMRRGERGACSVRLWRATRTNNDERATEALALFRAPAPPTRADNPLVPAPAFIAPRVCSTAESIEAAQRTSVRTGTTIVSRAAGSGVDGARLAETKRTIDEQRARRRAFVQRRNCSSLLSVRTCASKRAHARARGEDEADGERRGRLGKADLRGPSGREGCSRSTSLLHRSFPGQGTAALASRGKRQAVMSEQRTRMAHEGGTKGANRAPRLPHICARQAAHEHVASRACAARDRPLTLRRQMSARAPAPFLGRPSSAAARCLPSPMQLGALELVILRL